jgi:hypothetical protein
LPISAKRSFLLILFIFNDNIDCILLINYLKLN